MSDSPSPYWAALLPVLTIGGPVVATFHEDIWAWVKDRATGLWLRVRRPLYGPAPLTERQARGIHMAARLAEVNRVAEELAAAKKKLEARREARREAIESTAEFGRAAARAVSAMGMSALSASDGINQFLSAHASLDDALAVPEEQLREAGVVRTIHRSRDGQVTGVSMEAGVPAPLPSLPPSVVIDTPRILPGGRVVGHVPSHHFILNPETGRISHVPVRPLPTSPVDVDPATISVVPPPEPEKPRKRRVQFPNAQ